MELVFTIVNQSSDATLTRPVLDEIAHALDAYANEDLAPVYGGGYVVRASADDVAAPSECPIYLVDALSNVPGAIAYHSITPEGARCPEPALSMLDVAT